MRDLKKGLFFQKKFLLDANYENIAVTLCLMSIAILRRRLRDRARVRRRATRSWLLRRKQRSSYNTLLKELHTEDPSTW
jgi:ribose 1,5-bisphosphokinase PhnN